MPPLSGRLSDLLNVIIIGRRDVLAAEFAASGLGVERMYALCARQ